MIIEEKTHLGEVGNGQKNILKIMDEALKDWCEKNEWTYLGLNVVQFTGNSPEDSWQIKLNGEIITVEKLRKFINAEIQL